MDFTDKQQQIIDIAEGLFAMKGFEGTSVRDIAKEADVNVAMISYYFGSKEKLLESIFIQRATYITLTLEDIVKKADIHPMQKVELLIEAYIDKAFKQQLFHKIVVREQIQNKASHISTLMHEMKTRNQSYIKQLINEGQKQGVFKKAIDIPLMMTTMVGTTNQLITTQHFYREMNNMQEMPDEEFQKILKKKLNHHLKTLFKAILTYEA